MSSKKVKDTIYGCIPSEWDMKKIFEYAEIVTDYVANGSFASLKQNVQYKDEPDVAVLIRLVDYNNNFNGEFIYISENSYNFLKKSKLYGDEIIISNVGANVGTVFKCPRLKYKMSLAPNSIMMKTKGHDDFYYYWLKSGYGQYAIKSIVSGSAQPKFNKTDFRNLTVPVPSLEEQKAIAATLSCLDDKIELNNRINKNLEQIAQAIFKSWFVDFEPFQNGEFEDSELGRIPKGWRVGVLEEILDFKNGKKRPATSGEFPVYGGNGVLGFSNEYNNENVVVIGRVGAYCGSLFFESNKCWISDNAISAKSKRNCIAFCYYTLKHLELNERRIGTGQPLLTQSILNNIVFLIPTYHVMKNFEDTISPLAELINKNIKENKIIASVRDTQLPKLMSGEIRVPIEEVQ